MSNKQKFNIKNWKVILLSFIVAATFWFFKALNKSNYQAKINYPISFVYQGDSLIVTKPLPKHIKIDVSGGGWNLLRKTFTLSADPVEIRLSNPTEIKSITRVSLMPEVVNQLRSINIKQIITDTLHIDIERLITKKVPLLLDTATFSVEEGYMLTQQAVLIPDSVVLTGPVSLIKEIRYQSVSLDGEEIDNSIDKSVDLKTINEKLVTSSHPEVTVIMSIDKLIPKSIPLAPASIQELLPKGFLLAKEKDSLVNISFSIPSAFEDSVSIEDFEIMVSQIPMKEADSVLRFEIRTDVDFVRDLTLVPDFVSISSEE